MILVQMTDETGNDLAELTRLMTLKVVDIRH